MDRRKFVKTLGVSSLVAGTTAANISTVHAKRKIKWKLITAWPKNFPGLGSGANHLAKVINETSGGRMKVKVYGAGEMVPAFEVFDAVSKGTAQMGHASAMYWKGKTPTAQFFSGVPFGFTAQEMNAWLYYGGGMSLWRALYADFGLIPAAAGNTGVQMAGWFNQPINRLSDLQGLKMRIPGIGGEVLEKAGGTSVNIPGGEVYTSLKSGAIDALEWIGPYNDMAFGFHKIAKYYYYPGWQEPGTTLECMINKKAFEALPKDLQGIVSLACRSANADMAAEFTARNAASLAVLKTKHKVNIRRLPDEVLTALKAIANDIVEDTALNNPFAKKVNQSFRQFYKQSTAWSDVSEQAYFNARAASIDG
ncbi:MAG TPA: TRAP transporter substrate-binding protein [Gammaproteobacteria bacterium]|nr:TRAP transporter substrate-binding protein [Gammaproteobacteria bacterium]